MCQTRMISDYIVRIGTRSYKQQIEVVAAQAYPQSRLARLNRDLDSFYELLYEQWHTVTEADYKVFGQQLVMMLHTLKDLYHTLSELPAQCGLSREVEKLGMNYSAIYEVNSDIVNFRLKTSDSNDLAVLLAQASKVSSQIATQ